MQQMWTILQHDGRDHLGLWLNQVDGPAGEALPGRLGAEAAAFIQARREQPSARLSLC